MVRFIFQGYGLTVSEISRGGGGSVLCFVIGGLESRATLELPTEVAIVALERILEQTKKGRPLLE